MSPDREVPPEVLAMFSEGALVAMREMFALEGYVETDPAPIEAPAAVGSIRLRLAPPGLLTVAAPVATAMELARLYLPNEARSPELAADVIGELANVVAGQAKTALNGTPWHFLLSTPTTVVAGEPFAPEAGHVFSVACEVGRVGFHVTFGR